MTDPIFFPPGKLPVEILERLIRTYTSSIHGVVVGASIGEDAAAIDFGEKYLLAKTDPITFVAEDIGTYAIFVNSNDIAAMGGRPLWFLATVLLPEKGATPELVERIFEQLSSACRRIDVAFCGGHTEITVGIDRPIVIGTMLGEVEKNRLITTGGARPGDDILLTKAIAIEGTSIIAREKGEELARLFGEEILHRCRNLAEKPGISVLEDARIAMRNGRVHSMHDPTEGGLANALHEVAAAADVGLVVDEDRIPILDECRVLCRHYGLDPLGLIASGSLLIMVEPSDSGKIMRSLEEAGVPAAKIGRITRKERGVKSRSEGRIKELPRFARDEIAKILELPKDSCTLYTVYKSSTRQPALGFRQSRGSLAENMPSGVPEGKGGVMPLKMESGLHVGKVVEITAASTRSFEDAIAVGIDRASKTLKNVQGAWVKEQKVKVKDGKIAQYRVDLMVTFLLED